MIDHSQLQNLRTEVVESKLQIKTAAGLARNYCLNPILERELDKLIFSDWWKSAEILTDIIQQGKGGATREPVAFLLLTETNPRKKGKYVFFDLSVSCFAHAPFYDVEVVAAWADHRINKAAEALKRIEQTIWRVDERNVPLQIALRDNGFRVFGFARDDEKLLFVK